MKRRPSIGAIQGAVICLLLSGCTFIGGSGNGVPALRPVSPVPTVSLPAPASGGESADAVRARLCRRPPAPRPTPAKAVAASNAIREVERQVEAVRGLQYEHPVAVDAVTHRELVHGIDESFDHSFPRELMARRQRAWRTIGVIPPQTDLRQAYRRFLSSQVIGYYDPTTGQLVFIGTSAPSPVERLTLAHELTHADDDQHFNLSRLNRFENRCLDERELAATGAVEGSAVFFSFRVAERFFSQADIGSLLNQKAPPTNGVPLFLQRLLAWPYVDGPTFIAALEQRGGLKEVDAALRDLPVSTEQVMHPERYPDDVPRTVTVPPLVSARAHPADLDVMDVGEEWLDDMLRLRLPSDLAARATSGWDGGEYRAWSVHGGILVAMLTAWDTRKDASEFAAALTRWMRPGQPSRVARAGRRLVLALFASSPDALRAGLQGLR